MAHKKHKRHRPPKRQPVSDREFAARLARGGMALLDALPRVVAHGLCTEEQAAVLRALVTAEVLNASVAAVTGV